MPAFSRDQVVAARCGAIGVALAVARETIREGHGTTTCSVEGGRARDGSIVLQERAPTQSPVACPASFGYRGAILAWQVPDPLRQLFICLMGVADRCEQ